VARPRPRLHRKKKRETEECLRGRCSCSLVFLDLYQDVDDDLAFKPVQAPPLPRSP